MIKQPFYGGFGLLAAGSIPKPAFNAFVLLHRLGDQKISASSNSLLATRRKDGSLILALWNYSPPGNKGASKEVSLHFKGMFGKHLVRVQHADVGYGSVQAAYEAMGKPATQAANNSVKCTRRPSFRPLRNGSLPGTS